MKIIVEIGTDDQRRLIESELKIIEDVINRADLSSKLAGIWVSEDFDQKVNELQGTTDYNSNRGHLAIAKNMITEEGIALVFSPYLYTELNDDQTRMQIYLHEVMHVFNRERFHPIPRSSIANATYYEHLYLFFDEYRANRKSYELLNEIFPQPSILYNNKILADVKGFAKDVTDKNYHKVIKKEIEAFRSHGVIRTFIDNIKDSFDEVSKALVYFYSLIHSYPQYSFQEVKLSGSAFYDEHAVALIDYIKHKYENEDWDLFDGLDCIQNYLINFGMEFSDQKVGLYCHVHDIQ